MPSVPKRELVSLAAAAEFAAVHPKTLRRMIARGQLTGYRLGERILRVDLAELDRVLAPIPTGGSNVA